MNQANETRLHENVPCPFCGLVCDDLRVEARGDELTLRGGGCARSAAAFAQLARPSRRTPEIAGRPAGFDTAVGRIRELLSGARAPLLAGLGTDVGGVREALALADRTGGFLDHMDSEASLRNLRVLQDSGWIMTTLAELQNRADFVLVLGDALAQRYPRLFERHVFASGALSPDRRRQRAVCVLGGEARAAPALPGGTAEHIPCPVEGLGETAGALCALLEERPLHADAINGVPLEVLARLARRLGAAEYGVVMWAPGTLPFPHADLAVHAVSELVKSLNRTTRCSGLSIGGDDGGTTSYQVCTWQTGYPLRIGFRGGHPDYDPYHYEGRALLAHGECDLLIWISAFAPDRPPPRGDAPTVVLGHPHMRLEPAPEVFIPVAVPGLDHAGAVFRCDAVVSLPLRRLREVEQPSVAEVLRALREGLGKKTATRESP